MHLRKSYSYQNIIWYCLVLLQFCMPGKGLKHTGLRLQLVHILRNNKQEICTKIYFTITLYGHWLHENQLAFLEDLYSITLLIRGRAHCGSSSISFFCSDCQLVINRPSLLHHIVILLCLTVLIKWRFHGNCSTDNTLICMLDLVSLPMSC